MLTVYACQTDIVWEDKTANFAKLSACFADTSPVAGSLLVLPEMFTTGFSMNAQAIAEDVESGETAGFMSGIARQYECSVLGGMVTRNGDEPPRNEAVLFDPSGALTGRYAKMHPFTPSGEKDNYTAGDAPVILEIGGLRIAPLICYDLRFPELFREAGRQGAEAFIVIASWPIARVHHWSTLLRARAIENQAYVIGVNRVGTDPTPLSFPGRSVIIDPSGAVLAEADDQETILSATLDVEFVGRYRNELPFLADRRAFPVQY